MDSNSKFAIKFSEILDWIARFLFMSIMMLIVANVVARFFGRPLNGTSEWVGFLMASAIALALSYCAAQEGHVAVTILVEKLSPKKQVVAELIINVLILIFLIFLVRMLVLYGNRLLTAGTVGLTTKIPLYYFAYVIAVGFGGYCFILVGKIAAFFKEEGKRWISF